MEWRSNSFDDVEVPAVGSSERVGAYEKGNASQWKRLQQTRRRSALLYRLSNVIARGNFAEAGQILRQLGEDDFFLVPANNDIFSAMESAVADKDARAGLQALSRLLRPPTEPHPPVKEKPAADSLDGKDELSDRGSLDVTA